MSVVVAQQGVIGLLMRMPSREEERVIGEGERVIEGIEDGRRGNGRGWTEQTEWS